MEELAASVLAALKRSSAPVETKLALLNSLKSSIKHQRIPESAQIATIECIRAAITAQTSATLVTAGFATLTHLIKRLAIQEETDALFTLRSNVLALLFDKLGDMKEVHRQSASQALSELWTIRPIDVEKLIREAAIQGSNVRAKETGIEWVTRMHAQHALQFRNFVGPIVECLEDKEDSVRDCAKANILELFRDARDGAKADLRRQLIAYSVRRSISAYILSELQMPAYPEPSTSSHPVPRNDATSRQGNAVDASAVDPVGSSIADLAPPEPLYVYTSREFEDIVRQMEPCFEGRESEDNWKQRDTNTTKIRRLLQGNAPTDHHQLFVSSIKSLLDGILKVANSLRTTMATNGCNLVQELVKTLGSAIDPMLDTILQGFEKMAAATKHIMGVNANVTIDTICAHANYHVRLVQYIWHLAQDKNAQPRVFASGWLKTILKKQVHNKAQFEHSGGVELADKAIRKCLADPNPKARENMRSTFWVFAQAWPEKGEAILASLDAKSRQLLEKDPSNPNAASASASFTASVGPAAAPNPRAAPSGGRTSLKDTIAAQKRAAMAASRMPERPSSAMSSFSPIREAPPSVVRPAPTPAGRQARAALIEAQSVSRPPLTSSQTTVGSGLLSSAPMRRPRRPEMTRPATADLYTRRQGGRNETPPRSPVVSPSRTSMPLSAHNAMKSPTIVHPPNEHGIAGTINQPRMSPSRLGQRSPRVVGLGSSRNNAQPPPATKIEDQTPSPSSSSADNFTIVIPQGVSSNRQMLSPRARNDSSRSAPRLSLPTMAEEENFTLVMPRNSHFDVNDTSKSLQPHMPTLAEVQHDGLKDRELGLEPGLVNAFDFAHAPHAQGTSTQAETASSLAFQDEPLIIFEDPTIENIVIPLSAIDSARSALEELDLNPQQAQTLDTDVMDLNTMEATEQDERPVSPIKKKPADESPVEDRAEVLKLRRVLRSSIERLRTGSIDAQGFKRLRDLIQQDGQQSVHLLHEILQALLGYLQHPVSFFSAHAVESQSFRLDAFACMVQILTLPVEENVIDKSCPDILRATVLETRFHAPSSSSAEDLRSIMDNLVLRLDASDLTSSCLDQLSAYDWHQYSSDRTAYQRLMPTVLCTLARLAGNLKSKSKSLSSTQWTHLSTLALRCLRSLDVEVRQPAVEFCVQLYGTYGTEHKGEFWSMLSKAGEAQTNLVAFYLARNERENHVATF